MAEDTEEFDGRREYFNAVKRWAEANLEGRRTNVPFPIVALPWWGEIAQRLRAIETRLNESQAGQAADRGSFRCPLADDGQGEGISHLLVGGGSGASRGDGLKEIRDFTHNAKSLVVVDPYVYGGKEAVAAEYVDDLCKAARLGGNTLRELHVVYSSGHGNTSAIKKELSERAAAAKVKLTDCDSDKIHDRIWLADGNRGLVVGTSFGGLGNRAAFLLRLPEADLAHITEFLQTNGLLTGPVRRSKVPARARKRAKKH